MTNTPASSDSTADYFLVADIGGTNARLAIASAHDLSLSHQHTFACAEYDSLAEVVRAWQQTSNAQLPSMACFAIAGPIDNGHVKMTNLSWEFSVKALEQELGLKELHAINDFAAMANAAPVLSKNELLSLKPGQAMENSPLAIIGPGTGFGCAALVPSGNSWITLASEGGHASFAPTTELERQILELLSKKYPHVSVETLLCGRGMLDIYKALAQIHDHTAKDYIPRDITQKGLSGEDNFCVQSLEVFCGILGSVAADKALTYGARGGVFIGGGIVPRLKDFISTTNFYAHFINKGPMSDYVKDIPVQVMIAEQPALTGAAAWLKNRIS